MTNKMTFSPKMGIWYSEKNILDVLKVRCLHHHNEDRRDDPVASCSAPYIVIRTSLLFYGNLVTFSAAFVKVVAIALAVSLSFVGSSLIPTDMTYAVAPHTYNVRLSQ
jgi:hypothetical protein